MHAPRGPIRNRPQSFRSDLSTESENITGRQTIFEPVLRGEEEKVRENARTFDIQQRALLRECLFYIRQLLLQPDDVGAKILSIRAFVLVWAT